MKVSPRASRKGQTEILNTTLFFSIAVILFFSAFIWGSAIISGNSEEAKLFASEQFMRSLDSKIQNVAKNGGVETLRIISPATIRIAQDNTIEYLFQGKASAPQEWLYLQGDESGEVGITGQPSVIRERKEGDRIVMQLYYRNRTGSSKFLIYPLIYYEGMGSSLIRIESNGTETIGGLVMSRVKLSV